MRRRAPETEDSPLELSSFHSTDGDNDKEYDGICRLFGHRCCTRTLQKRGKRQKSFGNCCLIFVVIKAIIVVVLSAISPPWLPQSWKNYTPLKYFHRFESHRQRRERQGKGRSKGEIRLPQRLIFTYKYNLLFPSDKDPPFDPSDPLTANVLNTIRVYHDYWKSGGTNRPHEGESLKKADAINREGLYTLNKNLTVAEANSILQEARDEISFLSDEVCLSVIEKTEPRLVKHFQDESRGDFKADICRIAELYLNGGYYFDIDLGAIRPVNVNELGILPHPPFDYPFLGGNAGVRRMNKRSREAEGKKSKNHVNGDMATFVTVYNRQGRFFQAFTAAMPNHPVLRKSLEYMVAYYEGTLAEVLPHLLSRTSVKTNIPSRKRSLGMGAGVYTLKMAYTMTPQQDWEDFVHDLVGGTHTSNEDNFDENDNYHSPFVLPPNQRYSRFLYEVSLEDEAVVESGVFKDVPLQGTKNWCNYICFEGKIVYFYSRVKGSKGCPLGGGSK